MKLVSVLFLFVLTASAFSFGQSMMSTSNSNGNSTTMMSTNPMKADPRVGNQLRYAPSSGTKVIFTTLDEAKALTAKHPTVLFFAADWSPYCQADLRDINSNGDRLGEVAIVVADYDKTAELKARYGISHEDTFVQIDANGKQKAVWIGGGVDGILSHLVRS
jgi:thiol-disulfide isomerase/thioredoxin